MSFDAASLTVSQPLRRALAVALLVAAVALIATGMVLPAVERFEAIADGVSDTTAALARFSAVAARLPRLEAEDAALKKAFAAQDGFLKATNDSLIAAELQNRIKSAVERNGGQLKSTQILPTRDENGVRKIGARVEITGNADAISRIWYEMETGAPFLFIDSFDIEGRQVPRRDRAGPPVIALQTRFEVAAYAREPAP